MLAMFVMGGVVCGGCKQPASAAPDSNAPRRDQPSEPISRNQPDSADAVIARVNGRPITMKQLQAPLIEAYGLNILLNLVQLEMARDEAQRAGATVSAQDIEAERQLTLARLFPDADKEEFDALFEQFLQQQRISPAEFEIVLETNANLRKVADPQVRGKITEINLEEAFRTRYGETVLVRHIQCTNMTEITEAKRRLAAGESFDQVARAMSRNARTAPLGGELPPFSRASTSFPQAFRDTAFALKVGEVSDPVQADASYHLIRLEERISPKAVKFEDVKESLREDLEQKLVDVRVQQLRGQIGQEALRTLKVEDPTLREQYARRLESRDAQIRDRDQLNKELERQRQKIAEQREAEQAKTLRVPTVQPSTQESAPSPLPADPTAGPATEPATTQP